jgi:hypothetical protein
MENPNIYLVFAGGLIAGFILGYLMKQLSLLVAIHKQISIISAGLKNIDGQYPISIFYQNIFNLADIANKMSSPASMGTKGIAGMFTGMGKQNHSSSYSSSSKLYADKTDIDTNMSGSIKDKKPDENTKKSAIDENVPSKMLAPADPKKMMAGMFKK